MFKTGDKVYIYKKKKWVGGKIQEKDYHFAIKTRLTIICKSTIRENWCVRDPDGYGKDSRLTLWEDCLRLAVKPTVIIQR